MKVCIDRMNSYVRLSIPEAGGNFVYYMKPEEAGVIGRLLTKYGNDVAKKKLEDSKLTTVFVEDGVIL